MMRTQNKLTEIARWFDGEPVDEERIATLLAEDPECAAYLRALEALRDGAQAVVTREAITDAQFAAFMTGVHEGVDRPARGHRGAWAFASLTAAALIAALSLFLMLTPPSPETVVDACSTEVEGATVTSFVSKDGTAVVWVEDDQRRDVL